MKTIMDKFTTVSYRKTPKTTPATPRTTRKSHLVSCAPSFKEIRKAEKAMKDKSMTLYATRNIAADWPVDRLWELPQHKQWCKAHDICGCEEIGQCQDDCVRAFYAFVDKIVAILNYRAHNNRAYLPLEWQLELCDLMFNDRDCCEKAFDAIVTAGVCAPDDRDYTRCGLPYQANILTNSIAVSIPRPFTQAEIIRFNVEGDVSPTTKQPIKLVINNHHVSSVAEVADEVAPLVTSQVQQCQAVLKLDECEEVATSTLQQPVVVSTTETAVQETEQTVEEDLSPIPEIKNGPILIEEHLQEVAEAREEQKRALLNAPKKVKMERKTPKARKMPGVRPTVKLCTITEEQKKRWKEVAIFNSSDVAFDEAWHKRPRSHKFSKVHLWERWTKDNNVTLEKVLFKHFYPAHKRTPGSLPGFINIQKFSYIAKFTECDDNYDHMYERILELTHDQIPCIATGKPMSIKDTLECMMDLWACAMRSTTSWIEAYKTIFYWIAEANSAVPKPLPKYAGLHPTGLAMFYSGCSNRGIQDNHWAHAFAARKEWTKNPLSSAAAKFDWTRHPAVADWSAIYKMDEMRLYHKDLKIHCSIVNHLRNLWHIPGEHDAPKWSYESMVAHMYNWVVKPKLPKNVATAGHACPNCENPFCLNRVDSGECTSQQSFFERAQQKCTEFVQQIKRKVTTGVKNLVPEQFNSLLTSLQGQLEDLGEIVKSLASKISTTLRGLTKFLGFGDLTYADYMMRALDIVRYYIIYINTESSVIHALCIFAMLSTVGITKMVVQAIMLYMDTPTTNESTNQATFDINVFTRIKEVFSGLLSSDPTTVALPLTVIASILFGATVAGRNFTRIGFDFCSTMKNFHFIGGGILGLTRIFDVMFRAIKFVMEWCGKNFYNKLPEDEKKQKEVEELTHSFCKWATEVDVLLRDEMVGKLSANVLIQERVADIYARGLVYRDMKYRGELPDPLARDFTRLWKSACEGYNIILRAQSLVNFRVTPFHVQFYGPPGIGKSTLMRTISHDIAKRYFPNESNYIYAKGNTEQFDGYNGQPIYLHDDMFPANDYKDVIPLLSMVSNCPVQLYTSHLESKGTYFTSKFMLSTTNTPYPRFDTLYKNEAIWRRRHLLCQVIIDARVKDPATGKFCGKLFEKFYPNQRPDEFPHLYFSLYSPVKVNTKMEDIKVPPPGIAEPTQMISYQRFLQLFFARYESQLKEEADFDDKPSAKYGAIRKHLSEIDDAYNRIVEGVGQGSTIYENNFSDGNRNTMPSPAVPEPVHVDNFAAMAQSEDYSETLEYADQLIESIQEDVHLSVLDGVVDHIVEVSRKPYAIDVDSEDRDECQELFFMSYCINVLDRVCSGLQEPSQELLDRVLLAKTSYLNWIAGLTYFSEDDPTPRPLDTPFVDIMQTWCGSDSAGPITSEVIYNYSAIKVLALALNVELTLAPSHILAIETALSDGQYTAGELEYDTHVPSDATPTRIEDEIEMLDQQIADANFGIHNTIGLTQVLAAQYMAPHLDGLESLEPPVIRGLYQGLETHLIENIKGFTKSDPLYEDLFVEIAKLYRAVARKALLQVELRIVLLRQKKGKTPVAAQPIPTATPWFTASVNYSDKYRGFKLGPNYVFGMSIAPWNIPFGPRYPREFFVPNGELVTKLSAYYSDYGKFVLTTSQWRAIFGDQAPNGNTGITIDYLMNLKLDNSGDTPTWYWNTERYSTLCGMIRPNAGGLRGSGIKPAEFCSCMPSWQTSNDIFMNLTKEQQIALYHAYIKQSALLNFCKSKYNTITQKTASLFTSMWSMLTGGVEYMWRLLKQFKVPLAIGISAAGIIAACTVFSRLFIPQATSFQPSRVFARGRNVQAIYTSGGAAKKAMDGVTRCRITGAVFTGYRIHNHCLLVPWHAVSQYKLKNSDFHLAIGITPETTYTFKIRPENIHPFGNSDVALIYNINMPAWGDRTKYVKTSAEMDVEKQRPCMIVTRSCNGELEVAQCPYKGLSCKQNVKLDVGPTLVNARMGMMDCMVDVGVSGSPVFLITQGQNCATIAGFQSYKCNDTSYFSMVSRETIVALTTTLLVGVPVIEGPLVQSDEPINEATVAMIAPNMEVVSAVPKEFRTMQTPNSEFSTTILTPYFDLRRVPAILSEHDYRFDKSQGHPAVYSVNKHGRGHLRELPEDLLQQAVREYAGWLNTKIDKPRVLEMREAIEGIDDMKHVNLNSSPGLPWVHMRVQKGKKDFIEIDEFGQCVYIADELIDTVNHTLKSFRNGKIPSFSMMEIMKDELRPVGKAYGLSDEEVDHYFYGKVSPRYWPTPRQIKTRTITVMPMEYTVMYRMLFGHLFSKTYALGNTGLAPSCVGINMDGAATAKMYYACRQRNDCGFDLDVSNWDGHMSGQMFSAICDVADAIYKDDFSRERHALAYAAIYGHVQWKDITYRKHWGHPSGYPGTADFNTTGHILLAYVIWLMIMRENGRFDLCNFSSYLQLSADYFYGDDRLTVPDRSIADIYNGVTVAQKYAELGWPVTTAAKGEFSGLTPLSELQFLKRKFLVSQDDPFYVRAAMDKKTIETLPMYIRKTHEPRLQFRENLISCLEFACDWGREYYDEVLCKINKGLADHDEPKIFTDYETMRNLKRMRYFGLPGSPEPYRTPDEGLWDAELERGTTPNQSEPPAQMSQNQGEKPKLWCPLAF